MRLRHKPIWGGTYSYADSSRKTGEMLKNITDSRCRSRVLQQATNGYAIYSTGYLIYLILCGACAMQMHTEPSLKRKGFTTSEKRTRHTATIRQRSRTTLLRETPIPPANGNTPGQLSPRPGALDHQHRVVPPQSPQTGKEAHRFEPTRLNRILPSSGPLGLSFDIPPFFSPPSFFQLGTAVGMRARALSHFYQSTTHGGRRYLDSSLVGLMSGHV